MRRGMNTVHAEAAEATVRRGRHIVHAEVAEVALLQGMKHALSDSGSCGADI